MLESAFEKSVCAYIKKCGGRAYKWVSPGQRGVPDRICIFPGGLIIFIELKRPGCKDGRSPLQIKFQKTLTVLGCNVMPCISDLKQFKDELFKRFGIYEIQSL